MYKCAGSGSTAVYQDSPCPAGRELRNFATDPATVSVISLRTIPANAMRVPVKPPSKTKGDRIPAKSVNKIKAGDPGERKHIGIGMTDGEVIARIGEPDMTSGGKSRKVARWTYLPTAGDSQTMTTLILDFGKVVDVERKVVR